MRATSNIVDRTLQTLVLVALVAALPGLAFARNKKISKDISVTSNKTISVIVRFKHAPGEKHKDKIRANGGLVSADLSLVKAVVAKMRASDVAKLAKEHDVAYISPDRPIKSKLNNAVAAVMADYAAALGYDGKGIGVAVIDSGVHLNDDLKDAYGKSRVVNAADTIGGGTDDHYGHGTHIAGIISGIGKYSSCADCTVKIKGVAPGVRIINFHALNDEGSGTDSSVINAIAKAIALKDVYNIRVMNLSLGRSVFESYKDDPLCRAVEAAWKAGIVVVVAAGNDGRDNSAGTDGYGTINAPGNDPFVITVGAMNTKATPGRSDDVPASYSSKGPTLIDHIVKPDLVAPGNRIVSLQTGGTLRSTFPGNRVAFSYYQSTNKTTLSDRYYVLSGTSMATGVVSGAAAILLQQNPSLTPDQVKARLMLTAYKNLPLRTTVVDGGLTYTIQSDILTVGAGYLDLQAAMMDPTPTSSAPATSPTAIFDETTGQVLLVSSQSAIWGTSVMWSATSVWGSNAFLNSDSVMWSATTPDGTSVMWSALWGNTAVWGDPTDPGFQGLWGQSAIWGSGSTQTDSLSIEISGEE
jgi:serine protease AprX